eukprot:CAMPEP_0113304410 /NCGR_PEP_ID=MMETSP0010_2-20120614/4445_1 /TAXON_ID=216773 ORGANISM="Corethron hystrix, Strain 308" /NCGR_SAMPLE_ID=MMETSP0010_2 /ASSEMBLY_ACC=CAM_ASM_000155 /LENGTH=409 /DNA_ID=CAMNT_0000158617 /DNA_START=319 /DNA_END=1547 /DNA_ORIENTATION=+ /assembly_acc=CAM_ASM_000155
MTGDDSDTKENEDGIENTEKKNDKCLNSIAMRMIENITAMKSELIACKDKEKYLSKNLVKIRESQEKEIKLLDIKWTEKIEKSKSAHISVKYWKMPRHFIRKSVLLMIGLFVNAFVCLQKIDAQREFLLMLKTDCDGLKRKKEKLEKYVHELKSKGEATLSAVSYSLKEKRRQAQQEWENLEKAAFKKREKSETFVADLHRQAVKLLEPDLHNLLRKNETELENKKKGMRDEIARWKDVIEQKFERQLKEQESREKKRVEEQLSVIKLQAESDLKNLNLAKGRISESIQNDLTVQMERDRTSFDEEYRGQCKLHADQLNKLRSEESQKLDMIFKQHNKDMDLIHREQENAIWRQKELSAKQMERWKEQRTVQIRNEVRCEHDRELKSFEAKMKKDQQLSLCSLILFFLV